MKYEPHIDGLRAVAVIPVMLYHLELPFISGGYVGVDVFFAISGFLITRILLLDIRENSFNIMNFYKRRILRLLPALCIVLLATFLFSELLLFRGGQIDAGKSLVASALFASNIFFWLDTSYFSTAADTKPLLHTWSLAAEEQFYLVYPFILIFIVTYLKKYTLHVGFLIVILSLIFSILLTERNPSAAFYLLPSRAWELGLGALLAIWMHENRLIPIAAAPVLGVVGIVFIITPMIILNSESKFPGFNAIAPVVGTTLLIGWGNYGLVGVILASRPLVGVGNISYSLYLWHWPIIVFWKAHFGEALSTLEIIFIILLSLFMAYISTRFIEHPFRSRRMRAKSAASVASIGFVTIIGLAGLGFLGVSNLANLRTFPDDVQRIAATLNYPSTAEFAAQYRAGSCHIEHADGSFDAFDRPRCASFERGGHNVLLIGDSHAAHFWGALQDAMPASNVMQANSSGCRALVGAGGPRRCTDLRDWVFTEFLPSNEVDVVILAGRWYEAEIHLVQPTLENLKRFSDRVILVGPTVEYKRPLPLVLARNALTGEEFNFGDERRHGRDRINDMMRHIAQAQNVTYIDVLETICDVQSCLLFAPDGVPMQFDYGHLTMSGAQYVVNQNISQITGNY